MMMRTSGSAGQPFLDKFPRSFWVTDVSVLGAVFREPSYGVRLIQAYKTGCKWIAQSSPKSSKNTIPVVLRQIEYARMGWCWMTTVDNTIDWWCENGFYWVVSWLLAVNFRTRTWYYRLFELCMMLELDNC